MAQTYAEFLAAQGATPDDIKILDTPVARKGYEAQVKLAADAEAKRIASETAQRKWYDEQVVPITAKMQKERDTAIAESAADRARVKALQEAGLLEVASNADADAAARAAAAASGAAPAFDPAKHNLVTTDTLMQIAQQEGDAIAIAQDIAAEHSVLFPGQRLNFRELRKEAVAAKKSVEQIWMEKYGVSTARTTKEAADKSAYETKLRKEGEDAATAKFRAEQVNPAMGVAQPSRTPFTGRNPSATVAADGAKVVQPWERSEVERDNARQQKAISHIVAGNA